MEIQPIKKELQTQWMKIYPYSLCLDDIFFRERDSNGNLIYELLLTTHQFEQIIYDFEKNFKNLNQESFIYKYYDRDYVGKNEDWAKNNEEYFSATEFLAMLIEIKLKVYENKNVINAYNELIEICESSIRNKNQLFVLIDK